MADFSHRESGWAVARDREDIPYETAWLSSGPISREAEEWAVKFAAGYDKSAREIFNLRMPRIHYRVKEALVDLRHWDDIRFGIKPGSDASNDRNPNCWQTRGLPNSLAILNGYHVQNE